MKNIIVFLLALLTYIKVVYGIKSSTTLKPTSQPLSSPTPGPYSFMGYPGSYCDSAEQCSTGYCVGPFVVVDGDILGVCCLEDSGPNCLECCLSSEGPEYEQGCKTGECIQCKNGYELKSGKCLQKKKKHHHHHKHG